MIDGADVSRLLPAASVLLESGFVCSFISVSHKVVLIIECSKSSLSLDFWVKLFGSRARLLSAAARRFYFQQLTACCRCRNASNCFHFEENLDLNLPIPGRERLFSLLSSDMEEKNLMSGKCCSRNPNGLAELKEKRLAARSFTCVISIHIAVCHLRVFTARNAEKTVSCRGKEKFRFPSLSRADIDSSGSESAYKWNDTTKRFSTDEAKWFVRCVERYTPTYDHAMIAAARR